MIYLGSDHGGFKLKETITAHLKEKGIDFEDCGVFNEESVDYPDIAKSVCEKVAAENAKGILVCGTGIGMSIAANKLKGIRAAAVSDAFSTKMCVAHNNANVLCLGQRVLGNGKALLLVDEFLNTSFEGGRHERRVNKITSLEG